MRKEMMPGSVSPSLQVGLRSFENFPQFSSRVKRVFPHLLKCPHCPHGFEFSLSDLSRICLVREIRLWIKVQS